jgi:hypothetical protein
MTPTPDSSTAVSKQTAAIQYSPTTIARAERAIRCTAFRLPLFATMRQQSVDLKAIAGQTGVQNGYSTRPMTALVAERDLLWLIQVGVLRREVDGQGLTDSFRLTPLGHQLVERQQVERQQVERQLGERQLGETPLQPSLSDRLYNAVSRWMRLPI